jgi:HK97 family phage prohead protease
VLWGHDWSKPAIGRARNLRLRLDGMYGGLKFPAPGVSAEADMIYALLKQGILDSVSVGFRAPRGLAVGPDGVPQYQYPCELLELSVVNIPANPRAQVVARAARTVAAPSARWAGYTLELADETILELADDPAAARPLSYRRWL